MDMEQIGGDLDTVIDRIDVIEARVFEIELNMLDLPDEKEIWKEIWDERLEKRTDDLEKRIEKEVTTLQDQINRKLPKCE